MGYPDTELKNDALDPPYGGRPAAEFGGLAWQFVHAVLDFLERAHLQHNRAPYRTVAAVVGSGSLALGEVAVVDLGASTVGGAYLVRKAASGDASSANVRVLGVCVVGAGVGARALLATSGLLPRTVTGFASLSAGAALAVDFTAGRLKVAGGGDPVVAYADLAGNALLRLGA